MRGGIKKACLANAALAVEASAASGLKASVMRARSGNVRSTLRVATAEDKVQRAWVTIRQVHSARHYEYVLAICEAVKRGQVTSKEHAETMKDELMVAADDE